MVQVLCSVSGQSTKCVEVVGSVDHFLQSQVISGSNVQCLVNGRSCKGSTILRHMDFLLILPRLNGGKGGFGSMLRAIGAQIEATTNNDACRDLSGKRLRDVKCEKLLQEWSDKQAKDKVDRSDRKRQRLQRMLDGPSRMKSEDNTYISEMRHMSGSVEDAIAKAISEDSSTTKTQTSAPKKWFGDSDSSDDDEAASSNSTEDLCEGSSNSERENYPNEEVTEAISQQIDVPVEEEKGVIRITYTDDFLVDEATSSAEEKMEDFLEQQKDMAAQTDNVQIQQPHSPTNNSPLTPPKSPENLSEKSPENLSEKSPDNTPETSPDNINNPKMSPEIATEKSTEIVIEKSPEIATEKSTEIVIEKSPEIVIEKSPERPPRLTDIDLSHYDSVESLLSVGADNLKSILSERGLKCGGTALQRAERLFSVKGLNKEQINPAFMATAGKGKRRKIKS